MPKARRSVKMTSYRIHEDVIKLLDEVAQKTGMTRTRIVEDAIKTYVTSPRLKQVLELLKQLKGTKVQ